METIERCSFSSGHFPSLGQLYDVRYEKLSCFSLLKDPFSDIDIDLCRSSSGSFANTKTLHMPNLLVKIDCEDSGRKKFELFDLCPEQQLSVLAGIGFRSGFECDLFKEDENCSNYLARASLVYSILTEEHKLDISIFNNEPESKLELDVDVDFPGTQTHVITGLKWGGNFILTVSAVSIDDPQKQQAKFDEGDEETDEENEDEDKTVIIEEVRREIKLVLERMRNRLNHNYFKSTATEFESTENNEFFERHGIKLKFHLHGDFLLSSVNPESEEEAFALLNKIPSKLREVNDGKGIPVKFTLTPLHFFEKMCKTHSPVLIENVTISSAVTLLVTHKMDEILTMHTQLKNILLKISKFEKCIPESDLNFVKSLHDDFHTQFEAFREKLKTLVIKIRCGCCRNQNQCHKELVVKIIENYDKKPSSAGNVKEILCGRRLRKLDRHLQLLQLFQAKGISFIFPGENSFEVEILKRSAKNSTVFVLFKAEDFDWNETCRNFLRLKETEKDCVFLFVDSRLFPKEENPDPENLETSKIFQYFDGKLVSRNYGIFSLAVHKKTRCDVCSVKPIVGTRFKCEKCSDFNLCEKCHSNQLHRHHKFNPILYFPRRFPGITGSTVHKYVKCNGCRENPIVGHRFRCTICEDFDLCEKCHWNKLHDFHPMKKLVEYKLYGSCSVNEESECETV